MKTIRINPENKLSTERLFYLFSDYAQGFIWYLKPSLDNFYTSLEILPSFIFKDNDEKAIGYWINISQNGKFYRGNNCLIINDIPPMNCEDKIYREHIEVLKQLNFQTLTFYLKGLVDNLNIFLNEYCYIKSHKVVYTLSFKETLNNLLNTNLINTFDLKEINFSSPLDQEKTTNWLLKNNLDKTTEKWDPVLAFKTYYDLKSKNLCEGYFLQNSSGHQIGYIIVLFDNEFNYTMLAEGGIYENFQKKGYSKILLIKTLLGMQKHNVKEIFLPTGFRNYTLRYFVEKTGYSAIHTIFSLGIK